MNYQIFQQTDGFPLTTNRLDFLQASMLLMQEFGNIAGDLTIINGCEVNGTQVSNGTVFINGELLPFEGGALGDNVVIQQTRVQKQFQNGVGKFVEVIRVAKFGNGLEVYPWSDFTRITPVKMLQKALTPIGATMWWPWDLDNIPAGWQILDGEGTVVIDGVEYNNINMSERVARGFDVDAWRADENVNDMGETGGADSITLQNINMPAHDHGGRTSQAGEHYHDLKNYSQLAGATVNATETTRGNLHYAEVGTGSMQSLNGTKKAGRHEHIIENDGGLNGEAQPFDNRPKYRNGVWLVFTGQF